MATTTTFDLSLAIQRWREKLVQSPHFKAENVAELESHIRDSVVMLQNKGLSSEESFLIATHRTGSAENLEPEFAKINPSPLSKIIHALILIFFSVGCWFLWAMSLIPRLVTSRMVTRPLPGFTQLLMDWKWMLAVPPLLALGYCVCVWTGKVNTRSGWIGFFAVTVGVLMLLAFPIIFAVFLPLISWLEMLEIR
ncbi:MAG: hypothetical protein ABI042_08800 [Verrucomicrobiota bacterium]